MADLTDPRVAVYLDFDNIVMSWYDRVHGRNAYSRDRQRIAADPTEPEIAERLAAATVDVGALIDHAASFGSIMLTRAYADWSSPVNAEYRSQLVARAVDLVQLFPAAAYAKNGADIRLAVDTVEDCFRMPALTHLVIVAGDSDYVPLAQRAKRLGKYVAAIGVTGSSAKSLAAACDQFDAYEALPGIELPEREERPARGRKAASDGGASRRKAREDGAEKEGAQKEGAEKAGASPRSTGKDGSGKDAPEHEGAGQNGTGQDSTSTGASRSGGSGRGESRGRSGRAEQDEAADEGAASDTASSRGGSGRSGRDRSREAQAAAEDSRGRGLILDDSDLDTSPLDEEDEADDAEHDQAAASRLLARALQLGEDQEWLHSSLVKTYMRRMDPAFSEKLLGYRSFSEFLKANEDLVELSETGHERLVRAIPQPEKPARRSSRRRR